jgi:hypothetical protein
MPVFSYQSFNAGNSTVHNLNSLTAQQYTKLAHNHAAKSSTPSRLLFPTLAEESVKGQGEDRHKLPVQGPANLVAPAPVGTIAAGFGTAMFFDMMKHKVLQNRQALYRQMNRMPDVTAFGELNGGHADFNTLNEYVVGKMSGATSNSRACNNFTVYCANSAKAECVGQGEGWYAIRYLGYVVVFVHVPNKVFKNPPVPKTGPVRGVGAQNHAAKAANKPYARPAAGQSNEDRLVKFIQEIASAILQRCGATIDLIMGDTNQPAIGMTYESASKATGFTFKDAHTGAIAPIDSHDIKVRGTNAKVDKMYDVAVYNADTVKMKKVCYWSQLAPFNNGSSVAAVTDHMGLAIQIEKI